jgi:Na+/H+ antiporter NhaD/arsenite permease-like protein
VHWVQISAALVFAGTYWVVAVGRLPGSHMDRTGAALIGASLMVACGALTLPEAYQAINLDTLVLLLGMMIVAANLRLCGFFRVVNSWALPHAHRPVLILAAVVVISGVLSAFLVNDTVCLVLTPLVLEMVATTKRNPLPYVLAIPLASNVGSVATITGNPQNMLIGSISGIPYARFSAALAPVAAIGLLMTVAILWLIFRRDLTGGSYDLPARPVRYNGGLLIKSVLATLVMIGFFFAGQPAPKVAIVAGGLLLLTWRAKPERVYREIDFALLVMFSGLFIVAAGFEKTLLTREVLEHFARWRLDSVPILCAVSTLVSNVVSNVPAVLLLKPFILQLKAGQDRAWLVLAMSSTLAGNLTITGSVANLIVAQRARREGVEISFWNYFKAGAPLTVVTLAAGVLLLMVR